MSALQKFRTAFNGFNREDVVHYLEYINNKHTTQVNQLTSEVDFLRTKLESVQSAEDQAETIAALEQERDALRTKLEALQSRLDELEQQSKAAPQMACGPAEELEAYRRAERTERMARERADQMYRQANGALTEASDRVNDLVAQITPLADQTMAQLTQLQDTISTSKQALQDAAVIISTLHLNN